MSERMELDVREGQGHGIRVRGFVKIFQGDRLVAEGENKFVNQGLISLATVFSANNLYGDNLFPYGWTSLTTYILLGTDTSTKTAMNMTSLVSPIGGANPIKANAQSISNGNPSSGVYQVIYTATWNAGTIQGTVGEVGLYLKGWTTLQTAGQQTAGGAQVVVLFSRMSVADGDFTAYTINTSLPLTVQWVLQFSFS